MSDRPQAAGCGDCTMCCKLMRIPDMVPAPKPPGRWCDFCVPGQGCGIYADRPKTCRVYECVWLTTQATDDPMPADLRPDRCKAVVNPLIDSSGFAVMVDPARPDAWKVGMVAAFIDQVRRIGMPVIVMTGDQRKLLPGNPAGASRFGAP